MSEQIKAEDAIDFMVRASLRHHLEKFCKWVFRPCSDKIAKEMVDEYLQEERP